MLLSISGSARACGEGAGLELSPRAAGARCRVKTKIPAVTAARKITAAAVTKDDVIADFSSAGPSGIDLGLKPDVSAPGVNIYSTMPGGGTLTGEIINGRQLWFNYDHEGRMTLANRAIEQDGTVADAGVVVHFLDDMTPSHARVVRAEGNLTHLRRVRDDAHLRSAKVVRPQILKPHSGNKQHQPLVRFPVAVRGLSDAAERTTALLVEFLD